MHGIIQRAGYMHLTINKILGPYGKQSELINWLPCVIHSVIINWSPLVTCHRTKHSDRRTRGNKRAFCRYVVNLLAYVVFTSIPFMPFNRCLCKWSLCHWMTFTRTHRNSGILCIEMQKFRRLVPILCVVFFQNGGAWSVINI